MNPQKRKIAMLSIHSCPVGELGTKDTGGMSVYIRELARVLGKQGHSVDIFTRHHDPDHAKIMLLDENVRLIHVIAGDSEDLSKLSIYPHVQSYARVLDDFSKSQGNSYDVIHSHYWLSGLVGKFLQNWWNIPHMIMFHTLGIIKNNLGVGKPEPEFRICNEKALVKHCHRIIAATGKEKEALMDLYNASPDTIRVVPCGVNQDLFAPVEKRAARQRLNFSPHEKILLYVGRIEPLKGLDRVIQTVAQLKQTLPVKLVIVGGDHHDSEEMREVIELSKVLAVEDSLVFSGRVDQTELPYYYSAADALVVASLYESFGLVALEALSCGTPVVSTPVGGMKSLIEPAKNGLLFVEDTPNAMGKALVRVLNQTEFYETRTEAIRRSVSGYSWRNIASAIASEYEFLIHPKDGDQASSEVPVEKRMSCGF
ncbi:MAG: glycosyltransferase family 1 protein [Desulfobacteraceae bacterium]|nr:glycosyltransferase family 1 protein [Desulfobacteraceae bacterium]MBU4000724.1 glycosyltransferase [Pseudomonadota bacterium]MBU4054601.1 glycosyltransferase [Pseudomonadota bacterium]